MSINKTSKILQSQNNQLRRKETARANWIAGVSHDIRTPLSMIMGYAGQSREDAYLTDEERQKAAVIVKQSQRMRNLINDLNLASKLEYNMQPIHPQKENLIAVIRQVAVDFINMDIDDKHPIEWETNESLTLCPVNADKDLIKWAIGNLIQNCINHNEQGCKIYVSVSAENSSCTIAVADDGIGATDEQIEKLNNAPHYMVCDVNVTEQRHGLGLLIVKQIIEAHGGSLSIEHSLYNGFCVKITLPMYMAGQ
jgi:signal transduction histidine kinase